MTEFETISNMKMPEVQPEKPKLMTLCKGEA
jgi:hypothetical protein